jgi:phage/plasmid-associated DNA primase
MDDEIQQRSKKPVLQVYAEKDDLTQQFTNDGKYFVLYIYSHLCAYVLVQENFALLYKKESEKCDARDDNKYLSSYTGDFYLHRATDSAKNAFAILNADRSTRSVSRNCRLQSSCLPNFACADSLCKMQISARARGL